MKGFIKIFTALVLFTAMTKPSTGQTWPVDLIYPDIKELRVAFYVALDSSGQGNFHPDTVAHVDFLKDVAGWVNHRLGHLSPMVPAFSSPMVPDARVRIRLEGIFFIKDQFAWDCSTEIPGWYMREQFIDADSTLTYRQKHQTLPVFFGGNYHVAGGFASNLGDKLFVATRGYHHMLQNRSYEEALDECGRNLVHELCHAMGLGHNFQGGPHGDQCDHCEDNGCPTEGTSNNIMDYWPGYGYSLSVCQLEFMHEHLEGLRGSIAEVLINDSCYIIPGYEHVVADGDSLLVTDTLYLHGDLIVKHGGLLKVLGYLSVPGNCGIYLEPGAQLEINQGCAGNLCGDLWQGIILPAMEAEDYQTRVVLRQATIENARNGLLCGQAAVVDVRGSLFRNNVNGMVFTRAAGDTLLLEDCSFLTTRRLAHYDEGVVPENALILSGIGRATVAQCRFINEPGTFGFSPEFMGAGIVQFSGSLHCYQNVFMNLSQGVVWSSAGADAVLRVGLNRFENLVSAVAAGGGGLIIAENNEVLMQRFNELTSIGFFLKGTDRLMLLNNHIHSQFGGGSQCGIYIMSPGLATAPVFGNRISNIPTGIYIADYGDVDSVLFEASRAGFHPDIDPGFGLVLRENLCTDVDIAWGYTDRNGYGMARGNPLVWPLASRDPLDWPVGGAIWYGGSDQRMALVLENASQAEAFHGFVQLSGVMKAEAALPAPGEMETGMDPEKTAAVLNNLHALISHGSGVGSDVFEKFELMRSQPLLAASGKLKNWWAGEGGRFGSWELEEMARIVEMPSEAGELIDQMLLHYAAGNRQRWSGAGLNIAEKEGFFDFDRVDSLKATFKAGLLPLGMRFQPGMMNGYEGLEFSLYPNPAHDRVLVLPSKTMRLGDGWHCRIYDLSGRIVSEWLLTSANDLSIDIGHLAPGAYLLNLEDDRQRTGTLQLVKTH